MRFKWAIPSGAPSRARVLQLAGCAVLAWAWLQQSEPTTASALFPLLSLQSGSQKAADSLKNPFATAAVQAPQHAAAANAWKCREFARRAGPDAARKILFHNSLTTR